jgi:hypothetical protein
VEAFDKRQKSLTGFDPPEKHTHARGEKTFTRGAT